MSSNLLQSRFVVGLLAVIFFLTVIFLGRELYKKHQISREIRGLEKEIAALESKNKEIRELINYFKTPEYSERQARSLLNLQKPGEFAVALPPTEEAVRGATAAAAEPPISNLKKWWEYFFSNPTNYE